MCIQETLLLVSFLLGGNMAITKKSWQDYISASFGQVNEAEKSGVNYLSVGGVTKTFQGTITIGTSDSITSGTLASTIDGLIRSITVVTPALEGTGTATIELVDSLGGTVVSLAAQDESVTTNYATIDPIGTAMEWVATASGTQSAARSIIFAVHYDQ